VGESRLIKVGKEDEAREKERRSGKRNEGYGRERKRKGI